MGLGQSFADELNPVDGGFLSSRFVHHHYSKFHEGRGTYFHFPFTKCGSLG